LTAEKLLECASIMINLLDKGDLSIITEDREDAPIVPIDILK